MSGLKNSIFLGYIYKNLTQNFKQNYSLLKCQSLYELHIDLITYTQEYYTRYIML